MKTEPLKKHLIDESDFENVKIVQHVDEVVELLHILIHFIQGRFFKKLSDRLFENLKLQLTFGF